jgi:inositol transport system substrate-binding protein
MRQRLSSRLLGSLAATVLLVGSLGGGVTAQDDQLKIGFTFPILDQFLQTVADAAQAKADELGVELTIVSAEEDTATQLGQVENFITDEMDAIIIIPVDTDAAGPMTDAATSAGIPLVYVNRRPSDLPTDGSVPYVGSDSLYAGTVEMELLGEMADWEGNVVILIGDPANEAAVLRTQGCHDVIDQHDGLNFVKEQAGNWYRDQGLEITENWIQSGEEFDIICSNNDEMALGAIEALKNADMLDQVLVGGVDATADALAAMAAGELEVTVFQNAGAQGGGGVDAAVKLAKGEAIEGMVDGVIDVPYEPVTAENMADYMK